MNFPIVDNAHQFSANAGGVLIACAVKGVVLLLLT